MVRYLDRAFPLEAVFSNRPLISGSAFLQLPWDILDIIVSYIPESAFPRLSLANSDCYLIARTRQFATVEFRHNQRTVSLIQRLLSELPENDSTAALDICWLRSPLPHFGGFIRNASATIISSSEIIAFSRMDWHDPNMTSLPNQAANPSLPSLIFEEEVASFHDLIGILLRHVLFKLENFLWAPGTHYAATTGFLNSLSTSSIHHFSLGETAILPSLAHRRASLVPWKLDRLELGLGFMYTRGREVNLAWSFFLAHVAQNLRRLDLYFVTTPGHRMSLSEGVQFPCLEELKLVVEAKGSFDKTFFEALLPRDSTCCVKSLQISSRSDKVATKFLKTRGRIESIKTLIWNEDDAETTISFFRANDQLRRIKAQEGFLESHLTEHYLPLWAKHFKMLTTASILLRDGTLPDQVFRTIGKLISLENLHIGLVEADNEFWQPYWRANHAVIQPLIAPLRHLKTLVFSFDCYKQQQSRGLPPNPHTYYQDMLLEEDLRQNFTVVSKNGHTEPLFRFRNETLWEEEHKNRMMVYAKAYFQEHFSLGWLYLGQLVFKRNPGTREVLCPGTRGDAPYQYLSKVFGFPE